MAWKKSNVKVIVAVLAISLLSVTIGYSVAMQTATTNYYLETPLPIADYYIGQYSNNTYYAINGSNWDNFILSTNSSYIFSNVKGSNRTVLVGSGTYSVGTMWLMDNVDNMALKFSKGALLSANANLNTSVIVLYNSTNCVIEGATIDGNAASQTVTTTTWNGGLYMDTSGIFISGSNNKVLNCEIYDCRVCGVEIIHEGVVSKIENSGVVGSKIYNIGWNGVNVGGSISTYGCYAINNEVFNCSDVGIACEGLNSFVTSNYVHDMVVYIGGGSGVGLGTRWGIGLESGGVTGDGGKGNVVANNIVNNSLVGIAAINEGANTISNNEVCNSNVGIEVDYGENNTISGNLLEASNTTAIVSYGNDTLCTSNMVAVAPTGIWDSGLRNTFAENKILNTTYAIYAINSARDTIKNNLIIHSNTAISIITSNFTDVNGNTVTSAVSIGIAFGNTYSYNNTVQNNLIRDSPIGIQLVGTYGTYVLRNSVSNASTVGIGIDYLVNSTILSWNTVTNSARGYRTNEANCWNSTICFNYAAENTNDEILNSGTGTIAFDNFNTKTNVWLTAITAPTGGR